MNEISAHPWHKSMNIEFTGYISSWIYFTEVWERKKSMSKSKEQFKLKIFLVMILKIIMA